MAAAELIGQLQASQKRLLDVMTIMGLIFIDDSIGTDELRKKLKAELYLKNIHFEIKEDNGKKHLTWYFTTPLEN